MTNSLSERGTSFRVQQTPTLLRCRGGRERDDGRLSYKPMAWDLGRRHSRIIRRAIPSASGRRIKPAKAQ